MKDLKGRVAVVTGAASGIGRAMAEVFAEAGMKVMLGDIEAMALEASVDELRAAGHDVRAWVTDVSKADAVEALAIEATEQYGSVHVLCNNAGIGLGGGALWESTLEDWEWILGANLMSVVYGIRSFVPRMIAHGEGGHVVNTASVAGLLPGGDSGLYSATKFAVVSLSETLYLQLQRRGVNVSVSVLCPAWVNTKILDSERNRPSGLGGARTITKEDEILFDWVQEQLREGLQPRDVATQVLDAISRNQFYILTHPQWMPLVEARTANLIKGHNPQLGMVPGVESLMRKLSGLNSTG